jgi:hypothetical protein
VPQAAGGGGRGARIDPMCDVTQCPFCKRTGFVRQEQVIKGGAALVHHYCGVCEKSWTYEDGVPKEEVPPRDTRPWGRWRIKS